MGQPPAVDLERDRGQLLAAIERIGAAVIESLELDEILDILAHEIVNAGLFRSLMIGRVDERQGLVLIERSLTRFHGDSRELSSQPQIDVTRLDRRLSLDSTDIVAEVARTGEMTVIEGWDSRFDPRDRGNFDDRVSYFMPVVHSGHVLAILATGSKKAQKQQVLERIEFMKPLFSQASIAILHAQMFQQLEDEKEQHKRSEAKYRALFENMQVGFALHQMEYGTENHPDDYRYIEVNGAFENIIGISREVLNGTVASSLESDFFSADDRWTGEFAQVLRNGETRYFEHNVGDRSYSVCAYPVSSRLFVTLVTDISEQIRLEEEIAKNRNLFSLGALAAGIAHEFNNTLTGFSGAISLFKEGFGSGDPEFEVAEAAESSIIRARNLTERLITFAEGGRPHRESIDIAGLLEASLRAALEDPGIRVKFDHGERRLRLFADPAQIGQCTEHLAQNAAEAMPEGGTLDIRTEEVVLTDGDSASLTPGLYVRISFTDTGVGMNEEIKNKAFDPFFSTKPAAQGLGLSVVHSIVRRHGGTVQIGSTPDAGSTITILLPLEPPDEEK